MTSSLESVSLSACLGFLLLERRYLLIQKNKLIYIIKIGRSVCGQLCDWSALAWPACSAGQYARAGPVQHGPVTQAENERSEFSAC